jgi:cytidylate kinase
VRLIGSVEQRAAHIQAFDKLTKKETQARIKREDRGRRRYVKRYYGKDVADPLHYHLVINTDLVTLCQAAAIVGDLALNSHASESTAPAKAAA